MEHEIGRTHKEETSARERLEEAIKEYLASRPEEGGKDSGMLTGWVLVTEETNVVSGEVSYKRAVRDYQSPALTLGILRYADIKYSSLVEGGI